MDGRQMGRVGTGRGPPWMSRFSVRPVYMVIIVTVITRMPTSTFCGYAAVDPASALYDHPALVDDRNPVGELIRLVQAHWVVRSTVVPPATSARMISQTWLRLRGSTPWSARREDQVRRHDDARGDVDPPPASDPSRSRPFRDARIVHRSLVVLQVRRSAAPTSPVDVRDPHTPEEAACAVPSGAGATGASQSMW